ncbi:MAG: leucine-rich repeat protein [Ruminococcus sp.]|nr:leucine-rich repeat protein [Ruminococcus sp.]
MTQTVKKPALMRFATFITALAIMFTFFGVMPEGALRVSADCTYTYTDSNGTWSYVLKSDGTARLIGLEKSSSFSGKLIIPSAVNGDTVTEMNMTFQGDTSVKSVVMPDTLTEISSLAAFEECTNLTSVTFSKNLKAIPGRAFFNCTSLSALINFANNGSITEIGFGAFYNCKALTSVKLPYNLTNLSGSEVFTDCSDLKIIVFPAGLKSIPSQTVYNCVSLEYAYVPSTVTSISEDALYLDHQYNKYVPGIYGFSGSAAQTYAKNHGIEFVSLDEKISDISYDVSIEGGTLACSDSQSTSFTGLKSNYNMRITADESAVPAGKTIDHWEVKTVFKAQKRYVTHYPDLPVREVEKSFYLYDKDETAWCLLEDYIDSEEYEGYPKITATVKVTPVYASGYKITTADCTAYLGSTDTVITGAEENQTVRLVAAQPPEGYGFVEWYASNSSVKFYSADSKSAFFAMPPVNVTVYPVFAPLSKHKTTVTVTNYGSAGDYADVTVDEGCLGDTATVKIAFKNGTYSINKISAYFQNGSMTPSVPLTKVDDTTYTFTYPDFDVNLVIRVDVMRINDDPLDILISDTLSDDFEGDKVRYNELLAFVEYFKSAGKASYTVSGDKYYVDLDKNGSNDIIISTADMTVSKASTSSLPKIFTYTADDAAVKYMTDYLAKNNIWILRKELSIITKPTINAKSLGTQIIDLSSGSYQMTKEKDMSLMAALELLLNEGLIGTDESLQSIDLNNDGIFDLKIVMDLSLAKLSVLKPIGDSYTLALNDSMKAQLKALTEKAELTEYYDSFKFSFSARIPGDATGDGKVNIADVIRIQQKLAGWKVKINELNSDVTSDGKVNIADVIRIQQKLAGWKVTLK